MRIGLVAGLAPAMAAFGDEVAAMEAVGLESVTVGEAYTFDAVSQLGYLAARTSSLQLTTGILPLFSRTPTLIAMTAAGLDHVSDGRFVLGLGASGPQVVEGFHGVAYDAPLARTRETVEICRTVWRREPLVHTGRRYTIPLPPEQGTGEGKPLKLINRPARARIPITIAGTGPKNVALAAEIADGWEPIFFHPGRADRVWSEALAAGRARRDPELGPLEVVVRVPLAIGTDTAAAFEQARGQVALYVGGMGSRTTNFYNALARRYGYEAEASTIQDHYLAGRVPEAIAAVPDELVAATSLIGTTAQVAAGLRAFAAAGTTLLNVTPLAPSADARIADVAALCALAAGADEPERATTTQGER
jgi:F420-dependent oxidoreductase-like protein